MLVRLRLLIICSYDRHNESTLTITRQADFLAIPRVGEQLHKVPGLLDHEIPIDSVLWSPTGKPTVTASFVINDPVKRFAVRDTLKQHGWIVNDPNPPADG